MTVSLAACGGGASTTSGAPAEGEATQALIPNMPEQNLMADTDPDVMFMLYRNGAYPPADDSRPGGIIGRLSSAGDSSLADYRRPVVIIGRQSLNSRYSSVRFLL